MTEKIIFKLMRFNTLSEMEEVVPNNHLESFLSWYDRETIKNLLYFDVVEQRDSHRRKEESADLLSVKVPLRMGKKVRYGYVCSSNTPSICYLPELEITIAGTRDGSGGRIVRRATSNSADHYFHVAMALLKSWSINKGFHRDESDKGIPVPVEDGPAPLWNEGPEIYTF